MIRYINLCLFLLSQMMFAQEHISGQWSVYAQDSVSITKQQYSKQQTSQTFLLLSEDYLSKAALAEQGIKILRVLDHFHAIVAVDYVNAKVNFKNVALIPANNKWKLANLLLDESSDEKTYTIRSSNVKHTLAALELRSDVQVLKKRNNDIFIKGKLTSFKSAVLALPEVSYLGKESLEPQQEATVRDLNPAINNINKIYQEYPALDGNGVLISVKDNRFREDDIDLLGKLISSPLSAETIDGHATDMASIIAGLGNSSIKGRGVAPMAQLQSSNFLSLTPDSESFLSDTNIYLQNHSYGTIRESFYGVLAASYDEHISNNPQELHIFSSGNAGAEIPIEGPYADLGAYANLTGNFKMAKNTLLVGALDEEKKTLPFSSRGPAYDGRIKPDLVGYSITGTSNATALTTGVAALLQQRYLEQFGVNASAALLKAALINGADDIEAIGPDYVSGFGSLNAYHALTVFTDNRFVTGAVSNAQTESFSISIPPNSKNFKATMVWTDIPAEVNSNTALINDIDLVVTDAQGMDYEPWLLGTETNLNSLQQLATRGKDHLNNVEQVYIENPAQGEVTLQVTGFDIVSNSQQFAIAYSYDSADSFVWNYPLDDDNLPYDGETASYFRWESNFDQDAGEMAISYDLGETWETIESQIQLKQGYYLWSIPDDAMGTGILKMTIGTNAFESDPFTISKATAVKVALDCDDVVELSWNPQEKVKNYRIYNLQENQMLATAMTVDTTFAFAKSTVDSPYFAVEPVFETDEIGIRSETINYEIFDANCYESFVLTSISEDEQAGQLAIFLSSLFDVASIEVEKKIGDSFISIGQVDNLNSLTPIFLDTQPLQGLNRYRVQMILNDGSSFSSEEADLFFLTTTPFITFPNPIDNGMTVFTKEFDNQPVWFELFDLNGKMVFRKEITETQEFVQLEMLFQGIYVLRVYSSRGPTMSKLVYKL